jgi:hypothetical protein
MTFFATLSHQLPNGTRKHQADTLEAAKHLGDIAFEGIKLPVGGRNGAAEFRINVIDAEGRIVATRLVGKGHPWKDEPVVGSAYPKMVYPDGNTHKDGVIVNSREEEERVLAAEAPASPLLPTAPARRRGH